MHSRLSGRFRGKLEGKKSSNEAFRVFLPAAINGTSVLNGRSRTAALRKGVRWLDR